MMLRNRVANWKRILARFFILENPGPRQRPVGPLRQGEKLYRAPHNLEIMVHAGSMMITGDYLIETRDCLIVQIPSGSTSTAFVDWEAITAIEVH